MKKYRISVGLDVDDTLYECNSYALSIINSRYPDEEDVKLEDIKGWGSYGRHADERIALYSDCRCVFYYGCTCLLYERPCRTPD